jgi:hypothetical protein
MNVIIKAVSSQGGVLQEKSPFDLFLDLGTRLNTKHDDYWMRYLSAMAGLSKADQLANLQRATGSILEKDLRRLIDVFFKDDVLGALQMEFEDGKVHEIPYTFEQVAAAQKAKLMLSYCPGGINLEKIKEIVFAEKDQRRYLWQGDMKSFYHTTLSSDGYYFSGRPGEATFDGDYFEQTEQLADWLSRNISISNNPDCVQEALEEFSVCKRNKKSFGKLLIDKFRESAVEYIIRLLTEGKTNLPYDINNGVVFTSDMYDNQVISVWMQHNHQIKISWESLKKSSPGYIRCLPKIF